MTPNEVNHMAIRQLAESKTSPPPASVLRNYFIQLKAGFPVSHSPSFLFLVAPHR
jgi:hypothetical protein